MPHLGEPLIDGYVLAKLPADTVTQVEEHLLSCQLCRSRVAQSEDFIFCFQAAARMGARPAPRFPMRLWENANFRLPFAAAAALAVLLIGVSVPWPSRSLPDTVVLRSFRGPEAPQHVRAGKPVLLVFDIDLSADATPHVVELVNRTGGTFGRYATAGRDGRLSVTIRDLPHGAYWVRLYRGNAQENPVSEYGLQVD